MPRNLHAPMQTARSADRSPQNNGRGSPSGRASRRAKVCGLRVRGSKPSPLCLTICRPWIRKCGEQSRQGTGCEECWQTGTCELLSLRSGPLDRLPLLSRRPANAAFLQAYVLFMFFFDSKQWSKERDDRPQSFCENNDRLCGLDRGFLSPCQCPGVHPLRTRGPPTGSREQN